MEGDPRKKEASETNYKTSLHLISKESDRSGKGEEEEKKIFRETELRLGPPGRDWSLNSNNESFQFSGVFKTGNFATGAKRVFEGENEDEQKFCSAQKGAGALFSDPLSLSCSSVFQKHKTSFSQFKQSVQNSQVLANASLPTNSQTIELRNHEKGLCSSSPAPVAAIAGANKSIVNTCDQRPANFPVVGWPPVRSFRRNLANSSKPASAQPQNAVSKTCEKSENCNKKGLFVKIKMDGVPIGRKVDLQAYNSYKELFLAVDELFRGLLSDGSAAGHQIASKEQPFIGLLDGNGQYTLVYEDNEGDRMLAGDVPWEMFVSTVKRLRVLKISEVSGLFINREKQQQHHQILEQEEEKIVP